MSSASTSGRNTHGLGNSAGIRKIGRPDAPRPNTTMDPEDSEAIAASAGRRNRASACGVGYRNRMSVGIWTPTRRLSACTSRVACIESPPHSKKLSSGPTARLASEPRNALSTTSSRSSAGSLFRRLDSWLMTTRPPQSAGENVIRSVSLVRTMTRFMKRRRDARTRGGGDPTPARRRRRLIPAI
jgi:hypothetical protein